MKLQAFMAVACALLVAGCDKPALEEKFTSIQYPHLNGKPVAKLEPIDKLWPWSGHPEDRKVIEIDRATQERLIYRWVVTADTGVLLEWERGGKMLWRTQIEPADASNFQTHSIHVSVDGRTVTVINRGPKKSVAQLVDLDTGALLSRKTL